MKYRLLIVTSVFISIFTLTACGKKNPVAVVIPPDQQEVNQLPAVQQKEVVIEDASTYPVESFIKLANANDTSVSGDAYRSYLQNKFILKVGATLPDLRANENYQVWIFQPNSKKFVPIGQLTKKEVQQGNNWSLQFDSDRELRDFSRLVITKGKDITDPNKVKSILEGNF